MPQCQVSGCGHRRGCVDQKGQRLSFYAIPDPSKSPQNADLCKAWLHAIGSKYDPGKYIYNRSRVVCESHFLPECFQDNMMARLIGIKGRKKLKTNAVPSVGLSRMTPKKSQNTGKKSIGKKNHQMRKKPLAVKIKKTQNGAQRKPANPDTVEIKVDEVPPDFVKEKTGVDPTNLPMLTSQPIPIMVRDEATLKRTVENVGRSGMSDRNAVYPVALAGPLPERTPIQEVQSLVNSIPKPYVNESSPKSLTPAPVATEKLLVPGTRAAVTTLAAGPTVQDTQPLQTQTAAPEGSRCLMATYCVVIPSPGGNASLQFDGPVWLKNGNLTLGKLPTGFPGPQLPTSVIPSNVPASDVTQIMSTTAAINPTVNIQPQGNISIPPSMAGASVTGAGDTTKQNATPQKGLRSIMATYHVYLPSTTPGVKTFAMSCQGPVWVQDMPKTGPQLPHQPVLAPAIQPSIRPATKLAMKHVPTILQRDKRLSSPAGINLTMNQIPSASSNLAAGEPRTRILTQDSCGSMVNDRPRSLLGSATSFGSMAIDRAGSAVRSAMNFRSSACDGSKSSVGSATSLLGSLASLSKRMRSGITGESATDDKGEPTVKELLDAKRGITQKKKTFMLILPKGKEPINKHTLASAKRTMEKKLNKEPADANVVEDSTVDLVIGNDQSSSHAFQDELPETFYVFDDDEANISSTENSDNGSSAETSMGTDDEDLLISSAVLEDIKTILTLLESMVDAVCFSDLNDPHTFVPDTQWQLRGSGTSSVKETMLVQLGSCLGTERGSEITYVAGESAEELEKHSVIEEMTDRGASPGDAHEEPTSQTESSKEGSVTLQSEATTDCTHNSAQEKEMEKTLCADNLGDSEPATEEISPLVRQSQPPTDSVSEEGRDDDVEKLNSPETEESETREPSPSATGTEDATNLGSSAGLRKSTRKRKTRDLSLYYDREISKRAPSTSEKKKPEIRREFWKPRHRMSSLEIICFDHCYLESKDNKFPSSEKVDTILTPYGSVKVSDSVESIEDSNMEGKEKDEEGEDDYLDEIFIDDAALDNDSDSDYCPYSNKEDSSSEEEPEMPAEEPEVLNEEMEELLEKPKEKEEKPKQPRYRKTKLVWSQMLKTFTCKLCDMQTSSSKSMCHHLLTEHKTFTKPLLKILKTEKVPDPESSQTLYDFVFEVSGGSSTGSSATSDAVATGPADEKSVAEEEGFLPAGNADPEFEERDEETGMEDGVEEMERSEKDNGKVQKLSSSERDEGGLGMEQNSDMEMDSEVTSESKLQEEQCAVSEGASDRGKVNQVEEDVNNVGGKSRRTLRTISNINCESLSEKEALYLEFLILEKESVFPHIQRYIKTCLKCPLCMAERKNPKLSSVHHCEDSMKNVLCEGCGRAFSRFVYKTHIKTCQEDKSKENAKTNCKLCGRVISKIWLQQHIDRQHSGKVHQKCSCSICGKVVGSKKQCELHEAKHRKDFPFKCTYCQKGFLQKSNMRNHMRQHTGEQPYKCEHCPKSFTHNVSLKNHLKRYHDIDLWKDGYQPTKRPKRKRTAKKNKK